MPAVSADREEKVFYFCPVLQVIMSWLHTWPVKMSHLATIRTYVIRKFIAGGHHRKVLPTARKKSTGDTHTGNDGGYVHFSSFILKALNHFNGFRGVRFEFKIICPFSCFLTTPITQAKCETQMKKLHLESYYRSFLYYLWCMFIVY